jgi:peptidoglycan/xylan/chitin deacetylase (PgdA/CDA1 family)
MLLAALTLAAHLAQRPVAFVPPPILMYHRIDVDRPKDAVGRSLTVQPSSFDAELQYLKSAGIAVISMEQLYRGILTHRTFERTVVLTFDDGYADQYRYAVPLLQRYGDGATFYVVTGMLGRPAHLTWPQLRDMTRLGMDVAAHGIAHTDLSALSARAQAGQIEGSVEVLRDRLSVPVDSYAYPSGRFNRETLRLIEHAGIPLAVTTDQAFVLRPPSPLELTRIRVKSAWGLEQFARAVRAAQARAAEVSGI